MAYAGYQGYGTPASIDRQREIANALLGQAIGRTPRNIGEGLSAIGAALGYRGMTKRADKAEREAREASRSRKSGKKIHLRIHRRAACVGRGSRANSAARGASPRAPVTRPSSRPRHCWTARPRR